MTPTRLALTTPRTQTTPHRLNPVAEQMRATRDHFTPAAAHPISTPDHFAQSDRQRQAITYDINVVKAEHLPT
jgi:hypothetical protein